MLALSLGLFAALCWSLHDLVARALAAAIGPYRMAMATMLVGSALLSTVVLWTSDIAHASQSTLMLVGLLGVVYGIAVSSLFVAFSLAPVSIVGPFTAGYPALVVVWGVYNGTLPTLLQVTAIITILVGAIFVGRSGDMNEGLGSVAKGKVIPLIFFCVLASFCFATAVVLGQATTPALGEMTVTFLARFPAALVLLPFAWREQPLEKHIGPKAWVGITVMGLLDVSAVSGINYMGYLPFKELGAMGISAYGAVSVLLAMIVLKERVSRWQWFGIALIVAGVAILAV